MALTFVHTSDWHLGKAYERLGRHSVAMRRWRFDAVRRIYELAGRENAAFILVAGDLFQSDTPRSDLIAEVVDLLRDAPAPTIIIPGNHDPLTEGSVWKRDDFAGQLASVRNVQLALDSTPLELAAAKAVVFPCPVTSRIIPDDLTASIPVAPRGGSAFRIGLAHGRWQGYSGETYAQNFIAADRADSAGLDYLALGDFHSYTLPDHPAARARSCYSGTPECTAIDDLRSGYALVVRIESPGSVPVVTPHRVGRIEPRLLAERVLSPADGFAELQREIEALENPGDVLLGLHVSGALHEADFEAFIAWSNALDERFLGVERRLDELYREPSVADFDALGLSPAERRVLSLLRREAQLEAGENGDSLLATLLAHDDVRRESLALFYRELKKATHA